MGDGKVGFTLAEHLSQEEHDITVIDTNDAALRHASEALDVMCVKGNGASISALRESGVDAADVLIAATSMDEVNMVCCLTAKRLGAKYTIARVRNVEYAMELPFMVVATQNPASTWSSTRKTPRRRRSPVCFAFPLPPIWRPFAGVGWS